MYEVNGFAFESEKEAERAKKELEGIKQIKAQTKMDDPDVVLKLYNTLLQKKYFTTQVGMSFLVELQEYLRTIPYVKNEDIWPIPVNRRTVERRESEPKIIVEKSDAYKVPFRVTLFITFILVAIILGMFTISYYSKDNVNILNYENEIINKYESWEHELDERQAWLDEREAALKGEAE